MKERWMVRVFSLALCLLGTSPATLPAAELMVMPLKKSDMDYGCGCSFHYPPRLEYKGTPILQWGIDGPANIRVNNHLYKLSVERFGLLSSSEVGDTVSFSLKGADVRVAVDCKVTRVCEEDDEACEVTLMRGRLTVERGSGRVQLPVWGACGC